MSHVEDFGFSVFRRFADAIDPSGDWFADIRAHVAEDGPQRVELFHVSIAVERFSVGLRLTVTRPPGAGPAPSLPELTPVATEILHYWRRAIDPGSELASILAIMTDPEASHTTHSWGETRFERPVKMFAWTLHLGARDITLAIEFDDPDFHVGSERWLEMA